jgi:hypothetical protein
VTTARPHPQPGQPPNTPGVVPPPVNEIDRECARLTEQNIAGYRELQASGVKIDPLTVAHARIDHLAESFAAALGPQGAHWLALVRLQWEQRTAETIERAKSEGRTQNLAMGGRLSPQQIKEMARASGQFKGMFDQ